MTKLKLKSERKKMKEPRKLATEILKNIIEKKLFFNEAKSIADIPANMDTAFINMLVLTSLRHLVYIKKVLKQFVKKKLPADSSVAEFSLYLAITEILYLDTPDYAVINSYVNIVKQSLNKYIAGFVNAVLRNICKQKETLQKNDSQEFFPAEFFKILKPDYGKKTIQKIQKIAASEICLDITAKKPSLNMADKLGGTLLPNGTIRLSIGKHIDSIPEYNDGTWWVQDFSASLAVQTLKDLKDKKVLDICAAPGGKTAQLASAGAKVTALDISEQRLEKLKENLCRLRLDAEVICADGIQYLKNFNKEKFDIILLDAPCSATGTLRRHPELVHIKTAEDIKKQSQIQKEFLSFVGNALKDQGILLYCVCSVTHAEGEQQITDFLNNHPEFINLPITSTELFTDKSLNSIITPEGFIRTLPQHLENKGGCDSFFVARLQKVK